MILITFASFALFVDKVSEVNASKLRRIYVMVGCAMRTKMPTGRYFHGAHGAPYFDKTLNLLALSLRFNTTFALCEVVD